MEPTTIAVKGARVHNLKNVSLTLPRNRLICFTGVSGSGKSSFAFDTLYAEGQRRYIESLSSYARQFLGQLAKPDVDLITGLSPSISIQQKAGGWNPRSTVGTITQIHDYLRVLFARVGRQHCPDCARPISAQTREQIVEQILVWAGGEFRGQSSEVRVQSSEVRGQRSEVRVQSSEFRVQRSEFRGQTRGARSKSEIGNPGHNAAASRTGQKSAIRVLILAPVVREQKGEFRDLFEDMLKQGYARARVDGVVRSLSEDPNLDKNTKHNIEIVIDRLVLSGESVRSRLAEAVDQALALGKGTLIVAPADEGTPAARIGNRKSTIGNQVAMPGDLLLSSTYACTHCGLSFEPPSPQMFSFNAPTGMCLTCDGMGTKFDFDEGLLIPDANKSFLAPCVEALRTKPGRWKRHIYEGVARHVGFDLKRPWKDLPRKAQEALLHGTGDAHIAFEWRQRFGVWRHGGTFEGVVAELREKHRKSGSAMVRGWYEKFMRQTVCPDCGGARLNRQALAVRLDCGACRAPSSLNLHQACELSIAAAAEFFGNLVLTETEQVIAHDVLKEVSSRLEFLMNVGLDYLTLNRTAPTLSGGESQRIRLASQIGSGLVGVLYILDEPSIGLHARDNRKLLDSLLKLRDMGNTVIVVEHDEETMRTADHIVDFGPGPGVRGGEVVAEGTFAKVAKSKESLTGQYLTGRREIEIPGQRRPVERQPEAPRPKKRPSATRRS